MKILGIDPGIRGGLAIVEFADGAAPKLIDAVDIFTVGSGGSERVDVIALREWIREHAPQHAMIELAQSMPKQGVASTFRFGRAAGALEATIAACEVPMTFVAPRTWKQAHKLYGKDKEASRQRALQLFPDQHKLFARRKDHGKAEAALIALVGAAPHAQG